MLGAVAPPPSQGPPVPAGFGKMGKLRSQEKRGLGPGPLSSQLPGSGGGKAGGWTGAEVETLRGPPPGDRGGLVSQPRARNPGGQEVRSAQVWPSPGLPAVGLGAPLAEPTPTGGQGAAPSYRTPRPCLSPALSSEPAPHASAGPTPGATVSLGPGRPQGQRAGTAGCPVMGSGCPRRCWCLGSRLRNTLPGSSTGPTKQ